MAAAAIARIALWPELFRDATFMPFFCAVLLSAWYGGLWPGLLSLAIGAGVMAWGIFPPLQDFAVSDPRSQVGIVLYLAFGTAICVACHTLHAARHRERSVQAALYERDVHRVKLEAEAEQLAAEASRKDRFLAVLAHELRNPLAPIRYAVAVARRDPGRVDDVLAIVERQARHLDRLVDDLIDVKRIGREGLEVRPAAASARDVMEAAVEAARPAIIEARHQLDVEWPAPNLAARMDLVRATQVLTNLLNNAAKFTPPGGHIALDAVEDAGTITFRVTDDGVGVEEGDTARLFEMFERGPTPDHLAASGLGIGLALARHIAHLHGGSVELERAPSGTGTRACARFPKAADVVPQGHEGDRAFEMRQLHVLIADDNADNRTTLATLLALEGHNVRVAADGDEACRLAASHPPEVALIDLGMPGLDGTQVCRWIRTQPWGEACRLIAVTGWGQPADMERTRDAGFDLHLVKPVTPEAILAALRSSGD